MKCHSLYTLGGLAISTSKHFDCIEGLKKYLWGKKPRIISLKNSAELEQNIVNLTTWQHYFYEIIQKRMLFAKVIKKGVGVRIWLMRMRLEQLHTAVAPQSHVSDVPKSWEAVLFSKASF